jgi:hypothetical protein
MDLGVSVFMRRECVMNSSGVRSLLCHMYFGLELLSALGRSLDDGVDMFNRSNMFDVCAPCENGSENLSPESLYRHNFSTGKN